MTSPELFAADVTTAPPASGTGTDNTVRVGVVATTGPLTVALQGGTVVQPGLILGASVAVGDTVALIRQDNTWLCFGAVGAADIGSFGIPNTSSGQLFPGGSTTTGGGIVFVTLPGLTVSFTKWRSWTNVRIAAAGSWSHSNGAVGGGEFAILVAGADRVVAKQLNATSSNVHIPFSGFVDLGGLAVGSYTATPRFRSTNAGNTTTINSSDYCAIELMEVSP